MSVSVVVPTRNEGPWLERLLAVLREWDEAIEIVVADHESTDETLAIASDYDCRIVTGGLPGAARNRGAGVASGSYLLFVDADVAPTGKALSAVGEEVERATSHVVSFRHIPLSSDPLVRCCYAIAERWFAVARRIGPSQGFASFLLVSRSCFEDVGGFDVWLDPGEDVDFLRRVGRVAPVCHRANCPVFVSARRFSTERRVWFAVKTVFWAMLRLAGIRANPLPYRWIPHDAACADREARWLLGRPEHGN